MHPRFDASVAVPTVVCCSALEKFKLGQLISGGRSYNGSDNQKKNGTDSCGYRINCRSELMSSYKLKKTAVAGILQSEVNFT